MQNSNFTKENLVKLLKNRNLNNTQLAKILEVEPWTIGAWLSGKREISEKYKYRIGELISLHESEDLLITPALKRLVNQIENIKEESDLNKAINAMEKTINAVGNKLSEHSLHRIKDFELKALKNYLASCDDISLADLNTMISNLITMRISISSMFPADYAKECKKRVDAENSKYQGVFEDELLLEVDEEYVYAHYSVSIDIQKELYEPCMQLAKQYSDDEETTYNSPLYNEETGRFHLDESEIEKLLNPIKEKHMEQAFDSAYIRFKNTAFMFEENTSLWTEDNVFSMTHKISLNHTQLKDSLKMLMNRFGIEY